MIFQLELISDLLEPTPTIWEDRGSFLRKNRS